MRSNMLENALKDFGVLPPRRPVAPFPAPVSTHDPHFDMPVADNGEGDTEAVDVDALVAEAVARAEAALSEKLAQEHADALEAARKQHSGEIAEINQQFANDASVKIAAGIEEMENRIVELTSAVTARLVGVVLTDEMRQRSIARLADTIREAIRDKEAVRIRVRGSQSLYEALQRELSRHAEHLDFAESASFDLSVAIDDSVFETRMAEWSAVLSEALS